MHLFSPSVYSLQSYSEPRSKLIPKVYHQPLEGRLTIVFKTPNSNRNGAGLQWYAIIPTGGADTYGSWQNYGAGR